MAIKKCRECGKEVSTKANVCPNCGAPVKRKGIGCLGGALIILAVLIGFSAIGGMLAVPDRTAPAVTAPPKAPAPPPKPLIERLGIDTSPEMQANRLAFIREMKAEGVLYKIEIPGQLPHAYVTNTFMALPLDDKKTFANVIFTYYLAQSPKADILVLKDYRTGKGIGTFSQHGLDLD